MVAVSSSGLIRVPMKATFSKIISMVKVSTAGLMDVFIMVNGLIIKWRGRAPSHGPTDVVTLVAIKTIKSTVTALSNGPMAENISESGVKASNMVKVFT